MTSYTDQSLLCCCLFRNRIGRLFSSLNFGLCRFSCIWAQLSLNTRVLRLIRSTNRLASYDSFFLLKSSSRLVCDLISFVFRRFVERDVIWLASRTAYFVKLFLESLRLISEVEKFFWIEQNSCCLLRFRCDILSFLLIRSFYLWNYHWLFDWRRLLRNFWHWYAYGTFKSVHINPYTVSCALTTFSFIADFNPGW